MHDLIRDVALWIAKEENKLIMGRLKDDMIMKDHAIKYLWLEEVERFPNKLNCAQLEFLHISIYSEPCVTIPNDFFNGMEKLRVLFLENPTDQEDLALQWPISHHLMNNLRCLMLYCWVLGDISFIGSLEKLESLKIWDCSFNELPKCIIQQKKLRLLDFRSCEIQENPFEVMGSCSQLQVLHFCGNSGGDWKDQNNNSAEFFNKISIIAPTLHSYCIHFGTRDEDFENHKRLWHCNSFVVRNLYIEDLENCISIATSKDMMRRAKTLSLRRIPRSWKNVIPDLWQSIGGGMTELTHLALHGSDGIECVVDHANNLGPIGIISKLTNLTLTHVKNLKTLYSGQPPQGLFANLENLHVANCDSLEHILLEDGEEIVDGSECQSYGNAFPKLKTLEISYCKQLKYLMPISLTNSLAHLETLSVCRNDELTSVFGQSHYVDLNVNKPHIIEFSALENLLLVDMPNIISICPENCHPIWHSLKLLQLQSCPQLNIKSINHWIAYGGLRRGNMQMSSEELVKLVVSPLKTLQGLYLFDEEVEVVFDVEHLPIDGQQVNLSLRDLLFGEQPKLRHIWRGPKSSLRLQHLERLQLVSCGSLKQVFSSSILKSLPQLRNLYVVDCNELEEIIEDDDQNVSNSRQLVFPRLASIYIKRCHNLKCVLPGVSACHVIPNLRVLAIEDSSKVEQLFGNEQHEMTRIYEVVTPALEYVLLWNLPSLGSVTPSITFQTVRYIIVQQCPKLSLTSSVTPQELLKQLSKGYLDERYELRSGLGDIIKSMDDSSRETTQHIDCQGTGGKSNDQNMTLIASPNWTENKKDLEDQSAHEREVSEEKGVGERDEEWSTSENVQIVSSLPHSEPESSTKGVRDLERQRVEKENISRENDVKGNFESPSSSENAKTINLSTGILITSTTNTVSHIHSQTKFNRRKSDEEDLKDDDLISLLQYMEDDYGGKSSLLSVPTVDTAKDELLAKALADMEDSLKMSLKDIATSEANTPHLQTALNFLSHLSLEDRALSHGIMALIKSMHKDLPNILSSFQQAFATVNKFVVLEERDKRMMDELSERKKVAIDLVSKMSKTQKFMDETQEKEDRLKEQIFLLEKERKDCEAELLSLQEQKRKYVLEAVELKKEIEAVRKEMSVIMKDQRNARKQVFQIDHKWSVLCSQFEPAIAKPNLP